MALFTYTGPDASNTIRGVTFPIGEAVEVADESLAAKLSRLPYFAQGDAAEPVIAADGPVTAYEADALPVVAKRGPGRPRKGAG